LRAAVPTRSPIFAATIPFWRQKASLKSNGGGLEPNRALGDAPVVAEVVLPAPGKAAKAISRIAVSQMGHLDFLNLFKISLLS
jgi:hypothetical protein